MRRLSAGLFMGFFAALMFLVIACTPAPTTNYTATAPPTPKKMWESTDVVIQPPLQLVFGKEDSNSVYMKQTANGVVTVTGALVGSTKSPIQPAATLALTSSQCGSMILMGATTGEVVTLPSTPTVGCTFDFIITVSNTSASNEIETGGASPYLQGEVQHCATGIACLDFWATGSSTEAIKMNGSSTGGLIGSHFNVQGVSSSLWQIYGSNLGTATMTTAFTGTE